MVPGHRLLGVHRAQHRAGGVLRLYHRAVLAVEIVFKGVFHAVLADVGIGGVFQQGVFFILLLRHQADVAEDVRGIVRAVFARIRAVDIYAGKLVFHDGGYQLHAGVLDKDVVGGVYRIAHVDGIAHAGDDAHLLRGVAVVYTVARAHIAHQLHGGGVLRIRHEILELLLLVRDVCLQHRALYLRHVRKILKGRVARDGKVVRIHVAVALHHLHKAEDGLVRVFVGEELGRVYGEVIGLGIAHQHAAVAV